LNVGDDEGELFDAVLSQPLCKESDNSLVKAENSRRTSSTTFSLAQNVHEEFFDFVVLRHEDRQAILLYRVEGLCWVDSALEKDAVDAEICKNIQIHFLSIVQTIFPISNSLKYSLMMAAEPFKVIEFLVAVFDILLVIYSVLSAQLKLICCKFS
jgi:hypothetical protein